MPGGGRALHGEWDTARTLLAAIPDGLFVVHDGGIRSVNRPLCELVGFDEDELLGAVAPYPFWPPEHRHEIEAWHSDLETRGEVDGELTFRHRDGGRIRVIASGRAVSDEAGRSQRLVSVRDVSAGHRRELRLAELASHDSETGLLNRVEFEKRLGDAVRRALATGSNVTVVLAELAAGGSTGPGVFRRPEALVAVQRLRALLRVDDEIARTGEGELAWILHDTDAHGGVGAVARARTDLAALEGSRSPSGSATWRLPVMRSPSTHTPIVRSRRREGRASAAPPSTPPGPCCPPRARRNGPWRCASAPDSVTAQER